MRFRNGFLLLLAIATSASTVQAAPTSTPEGNITYMEGGWVGAGLRVQLSQGPFTNPSSCPLIDGYTTQPADSGHQLFNAMLLSAYMSGRRVRMVIDDCAFDRPRIISVVILPN